MTVMGDALTLAGQGLPVFACAADKRPAWSKAEGGNGFHDASTDADDVQRLFSHRRAALIGVPTGEASGIDALDIDPRHGGERWWLANRHRVPQTRMHRTRSRGLHVLFHSAAPVRNTESKIADGVDTRGQGGYMIWWPAHDCGVADAPLATWPDWLLAKLLDRPERHAYRCANYAKLDDDDRVQRLAARVLDRLERAAAGQRHGTLCRAAYTIGGLLDRLPFGEAEAVDRLCAAVRKAGAEDMKNAANTAASCVAAGRKEPLTTPGRSNG